MSAPTDGTSVVDAQKNSPADIKALADFLRAKNGPKVRHGILNGKRVDYFKGKTAVRTVLGPAYQKIKKAPQVKDEAEAAQLLAKALPHAFFLRVERMELDPPPPPGTPKTLRLAPQQSFDPDGYYVWFYDGSPLTAILGGVGLVVVMLAGVMFPLWPVKLRIGVWYLSIGALILVGAFIGLAIVRLIFYCLTVVLSKRPIWIFPNLFEDVGFVDSFIPGWAYEEPKKKKKRVAGGKDGKKSKKSGKINGTAGPGEAAASSADQSAAGDDAKVSTATSTAVDAVPATAPTTHRRTAMIEEIEDEEA